MSLSHNNACHVVPFLARLVLAAAFVTAGWQKLGTMTFTGDDAATLQGLSVGRVLRTAPASFQVGETAEPAVAEEQPPPAPPVPPTPPADPAAEGPERDQPAPVSVEARKLHMITLMLAGRDVGTYAPWLAWGAALTELVGGALLLVGLFSRIWGLGLAATMVVAFYLTSLDVVLESMVIGIGIPNPFNQVFNQLGLFVLSFGIFLTGPGAMSLDRLIFRRGNGHDPEIEGV